MLSTQYIKKKFLSEIELKSAIFSEKPSKSYLSQYILLYGDQCNHRHRSTNYSCGTLYR